MRRVVGVAVVALQALGSAPAGAGAGVSAETGSRTFEVRDLTLRTGEWIAFGLHPSEAPIELRVEGRRGSPLEACPASYDGDRPEDWGGSSWPTFTGFLDCVALVDGEATLPSTVVDTFHLAFLVRGRNEARTEVTRLAVTYEDVDPYFELFPPPVPAGRSSAPLVVHPQTSRSVSVGIYEPAQRRADDGPLRAPGSVSAIVRQGPDRVSRRDVGPTGRAGDAFGPVDLDQPVRVMLRNRGEEPADVAAFVEWG